MITLEKYAKLRGNNALTYSECVLFGIDDKTKGWWTRSKRKEYSVETIIKGLELFVKSDAKTPKKLAKESLIQLKHGGGRGEDGMVVDAQKLYLMKNVIGLYKVGISVSPDERCANLSNAAGIPLTVLRTWNVVGAGKARVLEKLVHKKMKEYKQISEWFNCGSDFITEVDAFVESHYLFHSQAFRSDENLNIIDSHNVLDWLGSDIVTALKFT